MTDQSEPGSPERLLRPLRRELSIELANASCAFRQTEGAGPLRGIADKNTENALSTEERAELESLVHANRSLQSSKPKHELS